MLETDQKPMSPYDATRAANKLKQLLERSNQGDREKFLSTFKQLRSYGYDNEGNAQKMYAGWELQDNDFKANINRVAEYVEIFGSHLYPQNPDASVNAQDEPDQWDLQRFALEAKLLDYCMLKGDLETSVRRSLNEALIGGRGMLWFGWNKNRNIPYAVFDTVENFGIDPDAKCPEEVNWIYRKRSKPRFEFKRAIGDDALFDVSELKGTSKDGDIIEYYEFYFRTGLHNYCHLESDKLASDEQSAEFDDSPKKLVLVENRLIAVTEWEIPFFQIDAWPCRYLDFRLQPEKLWPVSTLEPVLPHIKAMNWAYTAYLNRVKRTTHLTQARVKVKGVQIGDTQTENAMGVGNTRDGDGVIDVEVPNGMTDPDVRKLLQPLMMDADMPGFEKIWTITNRAFEDGCGLNDLLRAGQDSRQLRTAADVDFKAKRSMTRVDDMKKQFQTFFNDCLYSLAFTARFLMTSDDVGRLFGEAAGKLWGNLGDESAKQQDEMLRMQAANGLMQQALMQAQGLMGQAVAMTGQVPLTPPPLPTPEDIETQLGPPAVVTMEDWIHSATRQIVAGSMRPIDHEAQVENLNFYMQTMAPAVQSTPPGQALNAKMIDLFVRLNRYDSEAVAAAAQYRQEMEQIAQFQMQMMMAPPPPPGMGANPPRPGEEPSQGKEKAVKGQMQ